MDLFLLVIYKVWNVFMNTAIDITFQNQTYHITLFAIFIFTSITAIAVKVLFSLFE